MEKHMRALAVFCSVVIGIGGLANAQPNQPVMLNVIVMQVGAGTTNRELRIVTSGEVANLLNKLLTDTATDFLNRSQLRVSDGITSVLKIGGEQSLANTVCPAPLNKLGGKLEITPRVHHSGEQLSLNVALFYPASLFDCLAQPKASLDRNEFDLRPLYKGDVVILGGLKPLSTENKSTQLMIALIPTFPDVAR
jgi:hypothetical protein